MDKTADMVRRSLQSPTLFSGLQCDCCFISWGRFVAFGEGVRGWGWWIGLRCSCKGRRRSGRRWRWDFYLCSEWFSFSLDERFITSAVWLWFYSLWLRSPYSWWRFIESVFVRSSWLSVRGVSGWTSTRL